MGVVQLLNKAEGQTFSASDEALLEALCSHAALALERARLTEAYLEQQRLRAALDLAQQIQRSTLPDDAPIASDRVALHTHLAPASVVGGDLYDFFLIDERRFGFAVGDASGKGVGAALFMAGTQSLLRLVGQQGLPPERCFEDINRVQQNRAPMFVTLFYGILDLDTGRVEYCNAGHLPPVLLRSKGSLVPLDRARNLPLGLIRNRRFRPGQLTLGPGDLLFLYSDGVIEATDVQGEMFGEERLLAELASCPKRSPADLVHHIQTAIQRFCRGAPQHDDITMLALKYAG
jgi:sigma-B regulation protein RsbU (phosphoserine phosphatase)